MQPCVMAAGRAHDKTMQTGMLNSLEQGMQAITCISNLFVLGLDFARDPAFQDIHA